MEISVTQAFGMSNEFEFECYYVVDVRGIAPERYRRTLLDETLSKLFVYVAQFSMSDLMPL